MTTRIACVYCQGSGHTENHYAEDCDACGGSGTQQCEGRGCKEDAIALDEDGRALCEDCLCEFMTATVIGADG